MHAGSVAPAAVRQNEQVVGLRIVTVSALAPPAGDIVGGEFGCVVRCADKHRTLIADRIVNAEGNRHPLALGTEVMVIHRGGDLTPDSPGILEIADQFLLLGVDTDDRQAALQELLLFLGDVTELLVPLRASAGQTLGVGMQSIPQLIEQAPHRVRADNNVQAGQFGADLS